MLRLRQSVPGLEGCKLVFNAAGDVAFAGLRQAVEAIEDMKMRRHPLGSSLLVVSLFSTLPAEASSHRLKTGEMVAVI